jgi:DNA-binding protein H-NS
MAQTTLEIEIARIQQARLALQAEEEKIRKQFKDELLKSKAADKVIARVLKIVKENGVTRKQLLTALDNDSVYGDGKGTVEVVAVVEATDADVKVEAKKSRAPVSDDDKRRIVLPKYKNPLNPEEKWTGRGRLPAWVQKLKDNGTLESALIPQASDV